MDYNPSFLDKRTFAPQEVTDKIEHLNTKYSLEFLLTNHRSLENLGVDFIHASAQIEGNTYDKFDTERLLLEGQTAGGKSFLML